MDTLIRVWTDLVARVTGPFAFRFILQPAMGLLFATIDGIRDAKESRPPYFWSIFTQPHERRRLLDEGTKRMRRVIILGVIMDVLYQVIVLRWIYPGELILMVVGLAFLPYVLLRGPIARIARLWIARKGAVAL